MLDLSSLRSRFQALWNRCVVKADANGADQLWRQVEAHYQQTHRHYHTLNHIAHCLRQLDAAAELIERPDLVELAIWFHDLVYDNERRDNEAQSAKFFRQVSEDKLPEQDIDRVARYILTTTHINPTDDRDCQFMVDIDLSSFGRPWEEFRADSSALRDEDSGLSDPEFYAAKLRFLETLSRRETIFQTRFFSERLETTARENIRRYSAELREQGFTG